MDTGWRRVPVTAAARASSWKGSKRINMAVLLVVGPAILSAERVQET
jgi:hypothetical protein